MKSLQDRILALSDDEALQALQRFANGQLPQDVPRSIDPALAQQMLAEAEVPEVGAIRASKGDLARTTLALLATYPEHQAGIEAMLNQPRDERFAVVETALLVSAVLLALQTHVHFERTKDGQWSVKIEKKPTSAALLKDLIKKLVSFG